MRSPFASSNPLLFEADISGGNHEYRLEVREACNGSRYLRMVDIGRARRDEPERRGVIVFEECSVDLWWALTRAMSVLGDPNIVDTTASGWVGDSTIQRAEEGQLRNYEPWTPSEDARLNLAYQQGQSIRSIAAMLKREPDGIQSRLRKLGVK